MNKIVFIYSFVVLSVAVLASSVSSTTTTTTTATTAAAAAPPTSSTTSAETSDAGPTTTTTTAAAAPLITTAAPTTTAAPIPTSAPLEVPTKEFIARFPSGTLFDTFASNFTAWWRDSKNNRTRSPKLTKKKQDSADTERFGKTTVVRFVVSSPEEDLNLASHVALAFAQLSDANRTSFFSILQSCALKPRPERGDAPAPGGGIFPKSRRGASALSDDDEGGGGDDVPYGDAVTSTAAPAPLISADGTMFANMEFCTAQKMNPFSLLTVAIVAILIVVALCICIYCCLRGRGDDGANQDAPNSAAAAMPSGPPGSSRRTTVDPAATGNAAGSRPRLAPRVAEDPYAVDVGVRFDDDGEGATEMVNEEHDSAEGGAVVFGSSRW